MFEHGAATTPLRLGVKKDTVRFYADAMASDVRVGIGGYEFNEGRSLWTVRGTLRRAARK